MPAKSKEQLRLIYAQAAAGKRWAIKWLEEEGRTPPPVRKGEKKRRGKPSLRDALAGRSS